MIFPGAAGGKERGVTIYVLEGHYDHEGDEVLHLASTQAGAEEAAVKLGVVSENDERLRYHEVRIYAVPLDQPVTGGRYAGFDEPWKTVREW